MDRKSAARARCRDSRYRLTAGATDSGQIDWTVKDEKALQNQALEQAASSARQNAEALAKGMDVRLGTLIYASNQVSSPTPRPVMYEMNRLPGGAATPPPLAIEPRKVSREATVYAVFAIE